MKCRFIDEESFLKEHKVRLLQIECNNGFIGEIFVTQEPPFQINLGDHMLNTWHYEISDNKITLTGIGNNSVKFMKGTEEACHETINNVPLEE